MIKIPKEAGYAYPLGPKMEKFPIPLGYFQLAEAVERLGQSMFPSEWTGEERGVFRAGAWGKVLRSEVEYEVARDFDLAVLRAKCEKNCEDGGDPEQEFRRRTEPQRDDGSALDLMGDLPTLSKEEMKAVEAGFSDDIERAKSVRQRRERVEDRFLREMLWSGVLQASRVALDGSVIAIAPHTWAGPNGKRDFERGWVEEPGDDRGTKVRSILINQAEFDAALGGSEAASTGEVDALPDIAVSNADNVADGPEAPEFGAGEPPGDKGVSPSSVESEVAEGHRFSDAAVQTWYRERVEEHIAKNERPSLRDDENACKKHFAGKVPRGTIRLMRHNLAPRRWNVRNFGRTP